jgi:hypothetical protein
MMAQNIREPNRNSHEEYSTQKSKSVGAKHTEPDHHCLKKNAKTTQMLRNKNYLKNFWQLGNFKKQNS